MDKFTQMAVLLDIYGGLLTDKQKDVMEQYYSYDLSLQEIAENAGITKQGVHDLIRRAEHTLIKTDEKLGFINRLTNIQVGLEKVEQRLESEESKSAEVVACREEIVNIINTFLGG